MVREWTAVGSQVWWPSGLPLRTSLSHGSLLRASCPEASEPRSSLCLSLCTSPTPIWQQIFQNRPRIGLLLDTSTSAWPWAPCLLWVLAGTPSWVPCSCLVAYRFVYSPQGPQRGLPMGKSYPITPPLQPAHGFSSSLEEKPMTLQEVMDWLFASPQIHMLNPYPWTWWEEGPLGSDWD